MQASCRELKINLSCQTEAVSLCSGFWSRSAGPFELDVAGYRKLLEVGVVTADEAKLEVPTRQPVQSWPSVLQWGCKRRRTIV